MEEWRLLSLMGILKDCLSTCKSYISSSIFSGKGVLIMYRYDTLNEESLSIEGGELLKQENISINSEEIHVN